MNTIYKFFFGKYIGKRISLCDNGYYIGGDWIPGRYYSGQLTSVKIERDRLVLVLDRHEEITVSFNTIITILAE